MDLVFVLRQTLGGKSPIQISTCAAKCNMFTIWILQLRLNHFQDYNMLVAALNLIIEKLMENGWISVVSVWGFLS